MRETGLLAGWFLLLLSGILGCKSLRLLVETAKHVDAASYEVLAETVFGQIGWVVCNIMMFIMSWGPMLSYLMLVKDTMGPLLGLPGGKCLVVSSLFVMLPLCLQRDMADLAKTSRISVFFNMGLVAIIATFSPTSESISDAGGLATILSESTFRPRTLFVGLGIISFAFSCQHSSLIIAGSLENPTRERWNTISLAAFIFVSVLAMIIGSFGYVGFLEETKGNILINFPLPYEVDILKDIIAARGANVGRALLCGTMFCVYPLESFVARHVLMTNMFQGRDAHEGDDHSVLDRLDRRVATTVALYVSVLIPALHCDDVGIVLAWTGTVAATTLGYIGPGILFIGVHGDEFLDLVERKWSPSFLNRILWYLLLMPVWCTIASKGKSGLSLYNAKKEMMTPAVCVPRLGKVRHKREIIMMQKERRSRESLMSGDACESENGSLQNKVNTGAEQTSVELGLITATAPAENGQSYGSIESNLIKRSELQYEVLVEADSGEEDPQDEKQTATDFAVAIAFVFFGGTAFTAGIISIYNSG